jgi:hypothetical protein
VEGGNYRRWRSRRGTDSNAAAKGIYGIAGKEGKILLVNN